MQETDIVPVMMARMAIDLRGAKIIKHAERSQHGIPDVSCSWSGFTNWIEVKHLAPGEKLNMKKCPDVQMITCHELHTTTNGRCWYVIYVEAPREMWVFTPRAVGAIIHPRMVMSRDKQEPIRMSAEDIKASDLMNIMKRSGGLITAGWNHGIVSQLVKDATIHA